MYLGNPPEKLWTKAGTFLTRELIFMEQTVRMWQASTIKWQYLGSLRDLPTIHYIFCTTTRAQTIFQRARDDLEPKEELIQF